MEHSGAKSTTPVAPGARWRSDPGALVPLLAAVAALAVLVANVAGIATGDDGVGYRAIADSLLAGNGYGYFLEDPVTVWPPVWPALMAAVAWLTPLTTLGAAIVLNAAVAAGVVVVGNRLLRVLVSDRRIVLAGTAVLALGPSTIGLGHVLMTDMAFALVMMGWILTLLRFRRTGSLTVLLAAAALAWVGFGLRYVGLVLIAFGGLWLLLDARRRLVERVRNAAIYGAVAVVVPIAWMLRNNSIDGTFTGERNPSARGLVDNGFDVAATLGRFLLPGLGNGLTRIWAAIGIVVLLAATWLSWRVLRTPAGRSTPSSAPTPADAAAPALPLTPATAPTPRQTLRRLVSLAGGPVGLLATFAVLYPLYMLYVRTTTALNQLDLRLLYPAYFPLMFLTLALLERLRRLDPVDADADSTTDVGGDERADHSGGGQSGDGNRDNSGSRWERRGVFTAVTWSVVNIAAGLVAVVAFAAGHPYFDGNYESDVFVDVRANPAIMALPDGCRLYSNLPNGLYPTYEALWSPEQRALESSREVPGLEEITATLGDTPSCLVWIDEPPVYGHLWTLDELEERLDLEPVSSTGNVSTYKMRVPA